MEEEEILQFIDDQRSQGRNDQFIGRSLQMKGVSGYAEYLKKKRRYFDLSLNFGRGRYGLSASYSSSSRTRSWFFGFTCSSTKRS